MPNDFLHDTLADEHRYALRKVAAIACTADGGCKSCVADLLGYLTDNFPECADDFEEARTRWEAAGRPGIMGGELTFDEDGWPQP